MPKKPILTPFDTLTTREAEVAQLLCNGLKNRAIGEALGISPRTVEVHRARMMEKLGVRKVDTLKALAQLHGFSKEVRRHVPLSREQVEKLFPTTQDQPLPDFNAQFLMTNILDNLRGATIIEPVWAQGFWQRDFVGLDLLLPDGTKKTMWIDRDQEANGPGWVRVEPIP